MRKKDMCQQKTALDMILAQSDHGGMSDAAILLHKKQCEDSEKMDKRMTDIEKKVDNLDKKFDTLESKVDEIRDIITQKSSLKENVKEILNNKVFLYLLITIVCATLGVSIGEVGTFLFQR